MLSHANIIALAASALIVAWLAIRGGSAGATPRGTCGAMAGS
jgi:hypothetical protein